MKITLKVQKDSVNTLKDEILNNSNKDLVKLYIVSGSIKETGYDVIEECLIDLKAKKYIIIGIDKKNTTRKMLDNLLTYTKNVYVWDNNEDVELNANTFVFEYENEAIIYTFSGDITDSLLETDVTMYTVATYDLIKDKKEYTEFINILTKTLKDDIQKLTKEYITELSETKKIFSTRQYIHSVPSIAELLGNKEEQVKEVDDKQEKKKDEKIPKVSLGNFDDVSFEIDLGDIEAEVEIENPIEVNEVETDVSSVSESDYSALEYDYEKEVVSDEKDEEYVISDETIDLEELIFDTETVRLDVKKLEKDIKAEKKNKEASKPTSKKIDLKKVSNIIMQLPKKTSKGRDADSVKVPTYLKEMVPAFFEIMEEAKFVEREDGKYKEADIRLEIIDVNSGEKYMDNQAKLSHRIGQTYVTFESRKFLGIEYEELDIARVIKLSKDLYHVEIIPRHMEEYNLWKKMCTNTFRGSNRQYGLM